MAARLAADLLVVIHLAFVAFVLLGAWLVPRRPVLAAVHLPAVVWAVLLEWNAWICPLTPWEQALRRVAGDAGYEGGFVEHYLLPVLYPAGLSPATQGTLALVVVAANVLGYGAAWRSLRRARRVG
jgi:hypothetical protein